MRRRRRARRAGRDPKRRGGRRRSLGRGDAPARGRRAPRRAPRARRSRPVRRSRSDARRARWVCGSPRGRLREGERPARSPRAGSRPEHGTARGRPTLHCAADLRYGVERGGIGMVGRRALWLFVLLLGACDGPSTTLDRIGAGRRDARRGARGRWLRRRSRIPRRSAGVQSARVHRRVLVPLPEPLLPGVGIRRRRRGSATRSRTTR